MARYVKLYSYWEASRLQVIHSVNSFEGDEKRYVYFFDSFRSKTMVNHVQRCNVSNVLTRVMIRFTEIYWHIVSSNILFFLLSETLGHFKTVIFFFFYQTYHKITYWTSSSSILMLQNIDFNKQLKLLKSMINLRND